jgi:hypothetical protein
VRFATKANITLELDTALLHKARALAAEKSSSVSALLTACLERIVTDRKDYARARKRALARLGKGLDLHWTPPDSRDELH